MGFLLYLLGILAGLYLLLAVALYYYQPRMLYQPDIPSRVLEASPAAVGLAYESLQLLTTDGVRLHGWFVPAADDRPARGAVLFLHGNAGNISHRLERLALLHRLGLATLILDYRGYGRSDGRPTEAGTYEDADTAWRHLVETRGYAPQRLLIFGHSLGAAVAAELARRRPAAALVVEAAFRSLPAIAAEHYGWLPVRWLARYRYPVEQNLAEVRCPVLVAHSRADAIIPYAHGQALYAAVQGPRGFLELDGDHDRGFVVTGARYERELADFLDHHGLGRVGGRDEEIPAL
jgi:hypothetical protein